MRQVFDTVTNTQHALVALCLINLERPDLQELENWCTTQETIWNKQAFMISTGTAMHCNMKSRF
jgi:hypothetical protein